VLDGECVLLCEEVPRAAPGQQQQGLERFGLDGCCFDSSGSTLFAFGGEVLGCVTLAVATVPWNASSR
jgi:hypothetical protein